MPRHAVQPVVLKPLFKPKPWGGRRLAELFDKPLPGSGPIGESWEAVSLPGNESVVADGPLAGVPLATLVEDWGRDLLGTAKLADGRFPLLIKFLDARENLSLQVHPKPTGDDNAAWAPGIKHEAWYVLHADPGAEMYIGLADGVGPKELAAAANTPAMAGLLKARTVAAGDCFYLPSGTPHALGGGIVVAEVQTPSDVTYRLYDWDRVGLDGHPRELHIEQGLANIRYDVAEESIVQPRRPMCSRWPADRITTCPRFQFDQCTAGAGSHYQVHAGHMRVWIVLSGAGTLDACPLRAGDVAVLPAAHAAELRVTDALHWLDVTVTREVL